MGKVSKSCGQNGSGPREMSAYVIHLYTMEKIRRETLPFFGGFWMLTKRPGNDRVG